MGAKLWKRESKEASLVRKGRNSRLILDVGRGGGACEVSLGLGAIARERGNARREWKRSGGRGRDRSG